MTWVYVLLLVLLVVLLLILFVPVRIELRYKREGKDDRLHLRVRALFGLVRLGYDIPVISLLEHRGKIKLKKEPKQQMPKQKRGWVTITVEKIEHWYRQFQDIRKRIGKYKRAIRKLTKTFHIESFRWRTMFGTGDAAQTAYLAGFAWAIKGIFSGILYRYFTVDKRMQYDVKPHFQAAGFRSEMSCIIRFWPGKAIVAALTLVFLWLMEGIKWRSIRFKA